MAKQDKDHEIITHVVEHSVPAKEILENAQPLPLPLLPRDRIPDEVQKELDKLKERRDAMALLADPVPDVTAVPYAAVGKLFGQFPDGTQFVASAWRAGARGIFTAAHCVEDPQHGGRASNLSFCPQYNNGCGSLYLVTTTYFSGLYTGGDPDVDMAAGECQLPPSIPIASATAPWVGNEQVLAIGYPCQPPFDCVRMWREVGNGIRFETWNRHYSWMKNAMTQGCSGGPWLYNRWLPGRPAIIGLNSMTDGAGAVFSPSIPSTLYSQLAAQVQ